MQVFGVGDTVIIKFGPLANFTGVVQIVDQAKSSLVVEVDIFGRFTSVEVLFANAEKVQRPRGPYSDFTNLN
jgi:transcriptional antiterminator NusG